MLVIFLYFLLLLLSRTCVLYFLLVHQPISFITCSLFLFLSLTLAYASSCSCLSFFSICAVHFIHPSLLVSVNKKKLKTYIILYFHSTINLKSSVSNTITHLPSRFKHIPYICPSSLKEINYVPILNE